MQRVVILLVILGTTRLALATPPPPSPEDIMLDSDRYMIECAIESCSQAVAGDGRFGAVDIAWWYGKGKPRVPQLVSAHGLRDSDTACVRRALRTVTTERYDKTARMTHALAIGDRERVFPPGFLEALKLAASGDARRLRSLLPAWAVPWRPGCVVVRGPEPLYDAAIHWAMETAGPDTQTYYAERHYYSLPDDWWLSDPFLDRSVQYLCVEHVDHAVTVLRANYQSLIEIIVGVDGTSKLDAEWVIDSKGKLAGDVGMCLMPDPPLRLSHAELYKARRELEAMLGAIELGGRPGHARVRLHDDVRAGLSVTVAAASGPLERAASSVEQQCDSREQLRCSRQGTDFKPTGFDPQAIDRCLAGSRVTATDIAVDYRLLPDGTLHIHRLRGLYKPLGDGMHLCLSRAFSKVVFQSSTGGDCGADSRLDYLVTSWSRPTAAWTNP